MVANTSTVLCVHAHSMCLRCFMNETAVSRLVYCNVAVPTIFSQRLLNIANRQ